MKRRQRQRALPDSAVRAVAWLTGILTFLLGMAGQMVLLGKLGLLTYIDFGETIVIGHRYYDQEIDGELTALGWALAILNVMFSARVGMAVYHGHWRGGVPQKSEIDFLAWTYGLSACAITADLLDFSVGYGAGMTQVLKNILHIALIGTIAKLMYDWRNRRLQAFTEKTCSPES